jgi:hypothetical protein
VGQLHSLSPLERCHFRDLLDDVNESLSYWHLTLTEKTLARRQLGLLSLARIFDHNLIVYYFQQ